MLKLGKRIPIIILSLGVLLIAILIECERGSTLSWDEENKKVLLQANTSDKCYVYFDKYEIPIVNKVTSSNIKYNSITLNVDATSKVSTITKYYYSKDNGQSYIETTTNQYVFNNLESNKNGIASKEYSLNVSTSTYVNPSITKVTTSNISATSITLNVTATAGSNSISKYYYSDNNGSTWVHK